MEEKLVSVVLCTYNGARFLKQQIDSILAQTYRHIELIIADDLSTDDTRNILQQYESDPQCRVFLHDINQGINKNFAFAAAQARGHYIAFSDQDDIWQKNKIEKLVSAIGDHPLIYSDSMLVDEDGNSMNIKMSDLKRMYTGNDSRGYIFYSCIAGHAMMVTRALLERSLPMLDKVQHDYWITFQAFLNGGIRYYDEVLVEYRRHSETSTEVLPQKVATRKRQARFNDYKRELNWIKLMAGNERAELKPFYDRLVELFSLKEKRNYVWPLVFFMLKYQRPLFMLTRKNFFSRLVHILKHARGEKQEP